MREKGKGEGVKGNGEDATPLFPFTVSHYPLLPILSILSILSIIVNFIL